MKDKHLVFFDEATTVTDDDLAKLGDIIDRHKAKSAVFSLGSTISGRMTGADMSYYETKAHTNRGGTFDKAFAKAMTDAVDKGVGAITIDSLSELETRVTAQAIRMQRGSGKSNLNRVMWQAWDEMQLHTVKHDLKQLWDAQCRTTQQSSDPLFEAMELHNERIRLGKKAIKEMFHATPLNLNQQPTNGPIKAKDWE